MLSSITPLGERSRQRSWAATVTAFFVGAVLGGGALGAALGAVGMMLGPVPDRVQWSVGAVLAALLVVLHLRGRLPSWQRQVDERWLDDYRGWVVGVGYGFQLGAAVLTIVPTAAIWVALLLALLSGQPVAGAAVGAAFGVARALPLLAAARVVDPMALRRLHARLHTWGASADRAAGLVTVAVVVAMSAFALDFGATP